MIRMRQFTHVVTPNADQIVKIEHDSTLRGIYEDAGLIITDGTPLLWISKCYGRPIKQKIPGPLLTENVIRMASQKNYSVFFLGAGPGVAAKAAEKMSAKYPGLRIAGTYSPSYGFEKNPDEIRNTVHMLKDSEADILLVGLGSPKQDIFIHGHQREFGIPVAMSIGAAIDFLAGNSKRAPEWINKIGMEWLYRFFQDPARLFQRYFVDDMQILKLFFQYRNKGGTK
jgi:exopolysaccharide biosynthesis WecB/TagA/CpsF family protein